MNIKGITIITVNTDEGRSDITESESIIELMRFKKEGEKVKKNKMQMNNKEYYH